MMAADPCLSHIGVPHTIECGAGVLKCVLARSSPSGVCGQGGRVDGRIEFIVAARCGLQACPHEIPVQFRRIDSVEGLTIRDLNTEGSCQRGCEAIVLQQEHRPPILNEGSDGIHLGGGVAIAPAEADEPRIIELWKCKRVPFDTGDDQSRVPRIVQFVQDERTADKAPGLDAHLIQIIS